MILIVIVSDEILTLLLITGIYEQPFTLSLFCLFIIYFILCYILVDIFFLSFCFGMLIPHSIVDDHWCLKKKFLPGGNDVSQGESNYCLGCGMTSNDNSVVGVCII